MKTLKQHINEALKIGKNLSEWSAYSCQPKTYKELKGLIEYRISKEGPNCNLNDIDVSLIDDMSWLFYGLKFNGDISKWNTSKVKNMNSMFSDSVFNGDISNWNVNNVNGMSHMFARSKFNGDISDWNVSNVEDMKYMFYESEFNQDISKWTIRKDCRTDRMFDWCPIKEEYKPKR